MPNKLTGAEAIIGSMKLLKDAAIPSGNNNVLKVASNTVARTDTSAKDLFTIPANADVHAIFVYGETASDAGTTAVIDIGKTGTADHFVNNFDVKGSTGTGLNLTTAATNLGDVGTSNITVIGTYAETGGASTTGGDWTVVMLYS